MFERYRKLLSRRCFFSFPPLVPLPPSPFLPAPLSLSVVRSSVTEIFASLAQSRLASIQSTSHPFVVSLVLDPLTRFSNFQTNAVYRIFNFPGRSLNYCYYSLLQRLKFVAESFHDNTPVEREKIEDRSFLIRGRETIDTFRSNDIEYRFEQWGRDFNRNLHSSLFP